MKLQYETPRHCIEAVNQRVKQMGHGAGYRNDEKQVQCRLCKLWKYQDERCNLFEKKEGL